jgi:hypothetical protein
MIVLYETTPSFFESCVRSPGTPIIATLLRSMFSSDPALATHVSPRLYDLNSLLPPSQTMLGLCGDSMNGVFQLNRYASVGPAFNTLGGPPRPPNAPAACCGGVTAALPRRRPGTTDRTPATVAPLAPVHPRHP